MRKSELMRKCAYLQTDVERLERRIEEYKSILKSTRDCYGLKLMELEQKRLLLEHPDVIVDDIEWDPVEDYINFHEASYRFVYSIKGERQ